jgi:23S rRNA (pseudouridine1915-N3)-methyltransferase
MKFKHIDSTQWNELRPYLDTCLLPITGLTGLEDPGQATDELEKLQKWMDAVEVPYNGRIVTYPALHYAFENAFSESVNEVCNNLRTSGFRYVILMTANERYLDEDVQADLILSQGRHTAPEAVRLVQEMWRR